ncbi:UNVERIFIED_CONTAM: hypothetical protein RMT77_009367 [Armadillidium vulgare]
MCIREYGNSLSPRQYVNFPDDFEDENRRFYEDFFDEGDLSDVPQDFEGFDKGNEHSDESSLNDVTSSEDESRILSTGSHTPSDGYENESIHSDITTHENSYHSSTFDDTLSESEKKQKNESQSPSEREQHESASINSVCRQLTFELNTEEHFEEWTFQINRESIFISNSKFHNFYTDILYQNFKNIIPGCPLSFDTKYFKKEVSQKPRGPDVTVLSHCMFPNCRKFRFEFFNVFKGDERIRVQLKAFGKFHHDENIYKRRQQRGNERLNKKLVLENKNATEISQQLWLKSDERAISAGNMTDTPSTPVLRNIKYEANKEKQLHEDDIVAVDALRNILENEEEERKKNYLA